MADSAALWLILLVGGVLTYATRLSFVLLWGKLPAPEWFRRTLRFVPPAVLTAIIVPELLLPAGKLDLSLSNSSLLAGLAAMLLAWLTRSMLVTILGGLGVYFLLTLL